MQRTHLIHFSHDSSFSIRLRQDHTRADPVALHANAVIMRSFGADLQQCFYRRDIGVIQAGQAPVLWGCRWAKLDA